MSKWIIILLILFSSTAYAERCYVFIDKVGKVHKGEEAGCTEYGDVVQVLPFTKQNKPTRAERDNYKILVIDLTDAERYNLLSPKVDNEIVKKARQGKFNKAWIDSQEQEKEVDKATAFQNFSDKPDNLGPIN